MLATANQKNIGKLIGLGLLVRLIIFLFFYTNVTIFPDSQGYINLAERLLQFDLAGYSGQRSPGYPMLLFLSGNNQWIVVLLQFLLGVITSVIWYQSFLRLKFNSKASFYFSLFLSTLLNVIFFETAILTETFTLFLLSAIIYFLLGDFFNAGFKKILSLSLLMGLLTFVKPFYAFLPFLLLAIYLLKKFNLRKIFSYHLLLLFFPLLAYFGWSYVNLQNTGYFVSTTFFGLNVAQNTVRFAEKTPNEFDWISEPYVKYREKSIAEGKDVAMSIWYAYEDGAYDQYNLSFVEFSNELGKFGKTAITNNPLDYFQQVAFYSFVDFWKPVIYWNYGEFNFKYANKLFLLIWYVQFALLIVLRLAFIFFSLSIVLQAIQQRKVNNLLMLSLLVWSTAILQALVTYGTNSRFSFPLEFIMIMVVFASLSRSRFVSERLKSLTLV